MFSFKVTVFMLISLLIFPFWYSIQDLRNNLGSSIIDQIGKVVSTAEFLTKANTLEVVDAIKLVATNVIISEMGIITDASLFVKVVEVM